MTKPRSDSLFARLATADSTLELRDKVFRDLLCSGRSLEEVAAELNTLGVGCTEGSLSAMLGRHGLRWRLDEAEEVRRVCGNVTAKQRKRMDERTRANVTAQLYEKSFQEMSLKEAVLLKRTQVDEDKAAVQLLKIQTDSAAFILDVLSEEKAAADLRAVASDGQMTPAEKVEAIRRRVYGG